MTFFEFLEKFPTELACIEYYIKVRYGNEVKCNHCGCKHSVYHIAKYPKNFICFNCKNTFSIFKGTIFEKSCTDLRKWLYAIHLILNSKKAISALQLKREIGVTYKTAWRMLHKIREAMKNEKNDNNQDNDNNNDNGGFSKLLEGIVEIDETYIGGKAENMHTSKRINAKGVFEKLIVMGMIERNGGVKAVKIDDTKANTLLKQIYSNVKQGSLIITDELKGYKQIGLEYNHKCVNHSAGEYSRQENFEDRKEGYKSYKIYTNTIEGFWATLKRGVFGIYHHISCKYAENYINEFCFRYNNRASEMVFERLMRRTIIG